MHKMGLPSPTPPSYKEGIVDLPGRFGHRERRGMGKVIVAADNEGVKCIFRIQVRLLIDGIDPVPSYCVFFLFLYDGLDYP